MTSILALNTAGWVVSFLMTEQTDVVVVGAGLAGLACSLRCAEQGLGVVVVEAPTGRAAGSAPRSSTGTGCDRGFQVFNTAYPEAARLLDFEALRLCDFVPGAAVYREGRLHPVVNPLRQPGGLPGTLAAPLGSAFGKMAVGLASAISACPTMASPSPVASPGRMLTRRPTASPVASG